MPARSVSVPHPIPYQGSKRRLAERILDLGRLPGIATLYEPFAGSAAITIAAASRNLAVDYCISDSFGPLAQLWCEIVSRPAGLANRYEALWHGQAGKSLAHYYHVRDAFNVDGDPAKLLYLLTRCVKCAARFNSRGAFNQSADKRRLGMNPRTMRQHILAAGRLLQGRTTVLASDYRDVLRGAVASDLIYLDPPWQGTSQGRDPRYHQGLDEDALYRELDLLNNRGIPWLLSFDGSCGGKRYGEPPPSALWLSRVDVPAGRSSQATLSGRSELTIESLYFSTELVRRSRTLERLANC